ncbi:uncharacterized protein LOC110268385 [Arachis ipaensis]|uniref:uncharacterized protein LOC110268385 n=1 Tax=Arachis ipaensis TaxID=130454 RepID=UPI000A2B7353|nr:uncharacterized protein LOC110268385 [Arachis ipaensis]
MALSDGVDRRPVCSEVYANTIINTVMFVLPVRIYQCIKVRILRMWKVPSYEKSYSQPSMELVVLDKEGTRIHYFIRSFHYRPFESILEEGKVFVLANFTIDSNSLKFKPTKHNMRIIFKRDTLVSSAEDIDIPIESFDFVPTKEILSSVRDDLFLIGVMTITNTNYTIRLMVNVDLEVVRKFRQKMIGLGSKLTTSVDVIGRVVRHSPTEDFLSLTPYAPIYQIKQTVEKSTYVTCETVIDIDRDHAWWYKACRQCTQGLESLTDQFYCAKCDVYASTFFARFCIQVRVVDDSDTATFVLSENYTSKFLGLSAIDICSDLLAKGYGRDHFPGELNALIEKTLLFKLTVRHDSLNKFQACVITVSRICSDPEIMASLALENNINLDILQKVTTASGDRSGELIRTGSIGGVAGSITPPSSKAATICEADADHMATHTPVKRICIRYDDISSSRASFTASKSLLPTFERCM